MMDMKEIINYIMNNYLWIIIGVIVLLLAVIGRYADKTNFGEGKKIVKVKKKKEDLIDDLEVEKKVHDEPIHNDFDDMLNEANKKQEEIIEQNKESEEKNEITLNLDNSEAIKDEKKEISQGLTTDEFLKTDDLDILLPKKDTLSDDLLQDIDDISFDFKKKKTSSLIPDLDDVDLPSIKKKKTTTDIWK